MHRRSIALDLLRAMQMAEGDVVETFEAGGIDGSRPANAQRPFALADLAASGKGVGDQNRAAAGWMFFPTLARQRRHRALMIEILCGTQCLLHDGGFGVWKCINVNRPVTVVKNDW